MHKIFYGWWIVGLGFLAQFIGIGVSAYATSIFFQFMFSDLKWSRGDLALSMTIGLILAAIASPFVGAIVDRHGAGRIMAIGALTTGICLMLLGCVHELWQAFIIFSLLSLCRIGFVAIPGTTMVSNWFVKKRGRALGIMTAGQGMGGLILSPLTIFFISASGWRMAWVYIGILTMIVMIPSALLLAKPKPEVMGLIADGVSPGKTGSTSDKKDNMHIVPEDRTFTLKNILKMPAFWLIALLYPLYMFGHVSIMQHDYSLFTDKGIPAMTAGTMIGILGFFSFNGKIVLGYLSDKISLRYVMMIALGLSSASMLFLILAEPISGAWMFIIFWGFWECGIMALQPILIANTFNRAIVGKMLGIFSMFTVVPQIIGPSLTGYIFDVTGSYNLALYIFIIFYLISLVMVFFVGNTKRSSVRTALSSN
jgi:MFS transporter, OFA family, oxalate/formate antiporter